MKQSLVAALVLLVCTLARAEQLNVVASIPDLGDMARRIGGTAVSVTTLASGREDFHAVPLRPSFLPLLNRADLLLSLGLDAEHAWLPALAGDARNPRIAPAGPGWIEVHHGITVRDIPEVLDRRFGEQHPHGNPHYNIAPNYGPVMARNIFAALAAVRPDREPYLRANLDGYLHELDSTIGSLKERGHRLRDVAVIDYHPDMTYLCEFYGMHIVGHIEPRAGVAAGASHLRNVERLAVIHNVKIIIHNQAQHPALPRRIARAAGCGVAQIANAAGALPHIDTWIALQEHNLSVLLKALEPLP